MASRESAHHGAVEALRQDIAYVMHLLHLSHEAIICIDESYNICLYNQGAASMFGYPADEVLGKSLDLLIPQRFQTAHREHIAEFAGSNEDSRLMHGNGAVTGRRKNAQEFAMEASISQFSYGGEKTFTAVLRDVSERVHSEHRLFQLEHQDPLTGLPNRSLLMDRLATGIDRADRHRQKLAFLDLDLDGFRSINNDLDFAVGDALLQAVAERLSANVRKADTVARINGNEFAIILEDVVGPQDTVEVAKKVLQALMATPFNIQGYEIPVSASIGIAMYPDHANNLKAVIKHADHALQTAKRLRASPQLYKPVEP